MGDGPLKFFKKDKSGGSIDSFNEYQGKNQKALGLKNIMKWCFTPKKNPFA